MKKKWLLAILATSACVAGTLGLTACSETEPEQAGHAHVWGNWTVSSQPSDEATGKATRTCSGKGDCDATAEDKEYTLPVLNETDYAKGTDSATCSAGGSVEYTYDKDGVSVSFTVTTAATGHNYGTTYTYEDETGHWQVCANNEAHTTDKKEHDTEGADGACSVCGYKHAHVWSNWTVAQGDEPTAEAKGKATRTCNGADDCNATAEDKEYELPVLNETDYTVGDDSATCTETGKITYTYNKDGVNVDFDVATPVKPHTEQVLAGKDATLNENGLTAGIKCSECGNILVQQEVTAATGHTFGATSTISVDEKDKTISQRCSHCNKTIVYNYDNAVLDAAGAQVAKASALSAGLNYVTQSTTNPYLSYTFEEAGTYTIYWVSLNNNTFSLKPATFSNTTNAFISTTGNFTSTKAPEGFALVGYFNSDTKYYVTDENGDCVFEEDGTTKKQATAEAGEHVKLVKNSFMTVGLSSFVPVNLTFTITEEMLQAATDNKVVFSFRNVTDSTGGSFIVGINKAPTIAAEYGSVAEGNYIVKESGLEFSAATEAGTYTFTAADGKFEVYLNGEKYSDGTKDYFGYVDFCSRYLTVTLQEGDVVKVVKVAGRASDNIIDIENGTVEEPALPEYNTLELNDQTITLTDTDISVGKYEDGTEKFYAFTAAESGYFRISVADDVQIGVAKRVDKTHYSFVFDVVTMETHSGVFYAEAGETVILAFVGNNVEEFAVNIVACDEPITRLEVNEKLEKIVFSGIEARVNITVGDSVAEGEYQLTFSVSTSFLRAYIYFTVGSEIEVEDPYDSNAIAGYVNADLAVGANNTVGAGTRSDNDDPLDVRQSKDYTRTVTLKAGDVIYLASTATTAGYVDITLTPLTPVAE